MVCTEPLPKVLLPRTTARRWSCSAPATISDAEADPPLTSTTIGAPLRMSAGFALNFISASLPRPRVETITPFSRKASATATAPFRTPPGLLRRSSTMPFNSPPL